MESVTLTLKLSDFFWLAAGITALIVAYKNIVSISPVQKLKVRVDSHDEMLSKDKKRLDKVTSEVDDLKENLKGHEESNNVLGYLTLKSLQALMRNAQTGNNMEQLEEVSDELDDYILKK